MKRIIVLLLIVALSFGYAHAADYVEVDLGGTTDDTILYGFVYQFTISIENDVQLGGISLPFEIYSSDGVSWSLVDVAYSQFVPASPNGGTFVSGVEGSRWMSRAATDGSCWDLGGTLIDDDLAPGQLLIGGRRAGYNRGSSSICWMFTSRRMQCPRGSRRSALTVPFTGRRGSSCSIPAARRRPTFPDVSRRCTGRYVLNGTRGIPPK